MAMKTVRHPVTNVVRTLPEAEAEKLCKEGWVWSSKYEVKRQAAIARANASSNKTEAA